MKLSSATETSCLVPVTRVLILRIRQQQDLYPSVSAASPLWLSRVAVRVSPPAQPFAFDLSACACPSFLRQSRFL